MMLQRDCCHIDAVTNWYVPPSEASAFKKGPMKDAEISSLCFAMNKNMQRDLRQAAPFLQGFLP